MDITCNSKLTTFSFIVFPWFFLWITFKPGHLVEALNYLYTVSASRKFRQWKNFIDDLLCRTTDISIITNTTTITSTSIPTPPIYYHHTNAFTPPPPSPLLNRYYRLHYNTTTIVTTQRPSKYIIYTDSIYTSLWNS